MSQLVMYWKNDGISVPEPKIPDNLELFTIDMLENGIEKWLDIVQYGLSKGRQTEQYYTNSMVKHENYDSKYCYILMNGEIPAATVTVIFYPATEEEPKKGYIHMVACSEAYRGRGYGTFLNSLAVYILKKHGCETAWLTTDDWRIPAIKSYLRAGFTPDLSTEDFQNRWKEIMGKI